MMMKPPARIVVGTLYSGETEFAECCESVQRQTLQPVDHFVLRHMPKYQAHATLYEEFEKRAAHCDVFIKLDADMVILSDRFFERVAERFSADPELDHLKVAVSDFFTRGLIGAVNCYRSCCRWTALSDNLHTDAPPANRRKLVADRTELAPAAVHCKACSGFQAFHFGLHKGLKVHQAARERRVDHVRRILDIIDVTWAHFLDTGDVRLLLASGGAELALAGELGSEHVDYDNVTAQRRYDRFQAMPTARLKRRVRWMRLCNRLGLPRVLRARHLAFGWRACLPMRWIG
jgi:hypothetical protein